MLFVLRVCLLLLVEYNGVLWLCAVGVLVL